MAQERPNRFAEWLVIARENYPVLRRRLAEWGQAVREEPALIWQTRGSRYALYGFGLLFVMWGASALTNSMAPATPEGQAERATSGDFHVVCAREQCEHHFVIHRPFGFDDFPVPCPACGQETGAAARRCTSDACRGRWVAPVTHNDRQHCPYCIQPLGP